MEAGTPQSLAIDYLLGGHELLYPTGKRDGDAHLDARLRMFQTSRPIGKAQMEARIFYTRCFLGMKLDVKRAIRRLVWSGREDTKPFHLLPARIETYRVTPTAGKAVDAAAKAFEKSLARLKFDMHIHAEFGTDVQADWTARLRRLKRLNRHIYADAFPVSIALRFGAGFVPPAIDHAWEELWDAMGHCFQPKNRIRAVVRYPMNLRAYLVALGAK